MAYFGGGGQNGGTGRGGNGANPQSLLQGTQLFVNPNQMQFQGGGNQNYSYSQADNSQSQLQLNTGGTPLLLQPPVNFVTDQIGLGQLISQAAVTQNQQNLQNMMNLGNVMNPSLQMSEGGSSGATPKQRVFTGTVTKIHDNFGFIDEEVFFSMQVVKGPVLPKEGDRVLVEADFNPTMPFKWTSTRVQIVNMAGGASHASQGSPGGYPYNSSISGVNKSLAPPPPSISGRPQPVAIVSNPHSVYSSRPSLTETMPSRRVIPLSSTDSSIMSTGVTSMSSMGGGGGGGGGGMMGGMNDIGHRPMSGGISDNLRMGDRDRDMQRKDKDRLPNRDLAPRDRERSKERQNKDRDRRERSRDRDSARRRTRSRSRDRRSKRDSPARKRSRERDRGRDHRSGASVERSPKAPADPRSRRSRSRETIKSSDGRSVRSSVSPHRKGTKAKTSQPTVKAPRYAVQAPQFSLDMLELNGVEIKRRYPNLHTPSDFFLAKATWMQAFPLHEPYTIGNSSIVHIFGRHVQQLEVPDPQGLNTKFKQVPAVLPAPDASCTFTVKVMLLSCAALPAILKKCGCTNDEVVDEKENNQPLMRLLQFAVGVKSGAHEVIALGGSWSPSLDGLNPQSDPKVLVNTAMRCVKAQAGIDLSRVTKWYRFMELYYRRNNGNLETVVYFLPDTNPSTIPGQTEWDTIRSTYRLALYGKEVAPPAVSTTAKSEGDAETAVEGEEASKSDGDQTSQESEGRPATGTTDGEGAVQDNAEKVGEKEQLDEILRMEVVDECNGDEAPEVVGEDAANPPVSKMDTSFDIYDGIVEVDKVSAPVITGEPEKLKLPSLSIDPKSMTVVKLREELNHRNLNTKGLKQELVARLTQALKDDEEAVEDDAEVAKVESNVSETPTEPAVPAGSATPIKKEPEEINENSPKIKIVDPCSILEASIEGDETVKEGAEVEQHDDSNDEFPIIKESMSAEEKKVWERRYSVPKTPKLLVYPSKGDPSRDCTLMSLSTLRDYRASDKKEESFEVSLFSEFFFEMLQRDFAFKIYRELRKEYRKSTPDKVKVEEEEEKKEKDESSEPATKRRKTSTTDAGSSSEKMKVVDPMLLLAFMFFDTTRCGYIMEVDLEEICASIGIGITKRTIRKMAQKVVSKGSLHYRKLTDKPEPEVGEVSNEDADSVKRLAMGNKVMLPVFSFSEAEVVIDDSVKGDGDLAMNGEEVPPINAVIDGQVVDVRQMKDKLEKAEKGMSSAEASVNVLKNSLNEAKNHVSELQKSNDSLKEKLNKTKETLKKVESSDKAAKDDLEVFKRASERFVDRIKGLVKLPSNSKDSSKESSKEKSTGSSSKTKEESSSDKKPTIPVEVSGNKDPPNNVIAN